MNCTELMVIRWLDILDYESLFTKLCCGHFAVAAYDAEIGELHFLASKFNPNFMGHIFVVNKQLGPFDVVGYRSVKQMKEALNWSCRQPVKTNLREVKQQIGTINLDEGLHQKVYFAALQLLKESFASEVHRFVLGTDAP